MIYRPDIDQNKHKVIKARGIIMLRKLRSGEIEA